MRPVALLLLVVGCVQAVPAAASEESQALSSRGLIELNAGHTPQALELFDRAVAADPEDPYAHYQRGETRARLGDTAGAIEDLRAALNIKPDLAPAALELGIALVDTGQYKEAQPWLVQAQQVPDLDAQASFFLAIAQLRLESYEEAQSNFARASARDPSLQLAAEYYQGVIAYREHDLTSAQTHFSAVERASPFSAMGHESTQFLDLVRRAERAAYSAFGTMAFEYDSNVTLGPNSTTTVPGSITGEGDGRYVINAGATYVPWTIGRASLGLGYEFFQSLQFHLTSFNLQDHRPSLQLMFDFDRVFFGLVARYDYYLLGSSSFSQEVTAFPWISLREEAIGRTELYARIQWRHYYAKNSFAVLDGFYNFGGVRQVVDLGGPNRQAWFGYQLGFTNPTDLGSDVYQYGGYQLELGMRWALPFDIVTENAFRYERQNYNSASGCFPNSCPPFGAARRDNDYRVVVSFERPLPEIYDHLFVNAAWFGTFNDSNKTFFEYNRQIGSIGAEVRF